MTHGRTHAVGAGVATTDDDDVLAGRGDRRLSLVEQGLGVAVEEFHGEVDTLGLPAFDGQISRLGGTGAQHHGVEIFDQLGRRDVATDLAVAAEGDTLTLHLLDAAQHDLLLVELHVRDAVHEQAAGTVSTLKHRDVMARLVELGRGGESCRAGTDDGHLLAGPFLGRLRLDPTLFPGVVDDGALDVLDGHRRRIDAEDAGTFAGCRADSAGELREVVGLVQTV